MNLRKIKFNKEKQAEFEKMLYTYYIQQQN